MKLLQREKNNPNSFAHTSHTQVHTRSQTDQETKQSHVKLTQQSGHVLENSEQLRGDGWAVLQSHQPA